MKLLESTTHNAYPIVDTESKLNTDGTLSYGRLRGLMTRHDIVTMLFHRIFVENNRFGAAESYEMLREKYPRLERVQEWSISQIYCLHLQMLPADESVM